MSTDFLLFVEENVTIVVTFYCFSDLIAERTVKL